MHNVSTDQLKRVIESQHGGKARFRQSMRILNPSLKQNDWDGIVHIFDLADHPKTKRAYAWSSSIKGGARPRFFAVLHGGGITGPVEAVKAAAIVIRNGGVKTKSAKAAPAAGAQPAAAQRASSTAAHKV